MLAELGAPDVLICLAASNMPLVKLPNLQFGISLLQGWGEQTVTVVHRSRARRGVPIVPHANLRCFQSHTYVLVSSIFFWH